MENVKYYKDLNHNYLIIKDKAREAPSYQHKMITSNRMKHFLACKIRYIDQECHFYYEISSRQNLVCLFDRNPMEYGQIRRLFEDMQEALDELGNYLLDSRGLMLQPEYIFRNPAAEEYFFLYYPYYMEEEANSLPLAEFLVEKADHGQEDAVSAVYKIYEMAQDDGFIITEILDIFSGAEEAVGKTPDEPADIALEEEPELPVFEKPDFSGKKEQDREEEAYRHLGVAGVLGTVCALAAAAVFGVRYYYVLSAQEMLLFVVGGLTLIVLAAAFFLYFIFHMWNRKRNWKRSAKSMEKAEALWVGQEKGTEPYPVLDAPSLDSYGEVPVAWDMKNAKRGKRNSGEEETEYGNTVFLEAAACKTEHKLYGTNKGNKYHIDLEKLPCTVGKMAGSVDVVIKDSTVSRIHARFTRQEEGICVTDMNSTNGTFKNGLRLEPNETVAIEQGDEVRFGRMTFCYR